MENPAATRALVCGGRDWHERDVTFAILDRVHQQYNITTVIHGAANGADTLADQWARSRGIPVEPYPADWQPASLNGRLDRGAGYARNQRMLQEGRPDIVVAMPGGRGTKDMMRRARQAGVSVLNFEAARRGKARDGNMIERRDGDILQVRDADALVNPVNCAGRMGRGLAAQFARRYPEVEREYRRICRQRELRPGRVRLHEIGNPDDRPRWIVSFPTKDHWRNPSLMEWVTNGMQDLMGQLDQAGATAVAIPYLGAGLGGLRPDAVAQAIEEEAQRWPNIRAILMNRSR